jgi:hypothetical protein
MVAPQTNMHGMGCVDAHPPPLAWPKLFCPAIFFSAFEFGGATHASRLVGEAKRSKTPLPNKAGPLRFISDFKINQPIGGPTKQKDRGTFARLLGLRHRSQTPPDRTNASNPGKSGTVYCAA